MTVTSENGAARGVASRAVEMAGLEFTPVRQDELERRTQELGRQLLRQMQKHGGRLWSVDMWHDRAMNLFLADNDVRTRLLRFVDAYPALKSASSASHHFAQYLPPGTRNSPLVLKMGSSVATMGGLPGAVQGAAIGLGVQMMANRFICGETAERALRTIRRLRNKGLHYTMDLPGEEVVSEEEADEHTAAYVKVLEDLQGGGESRQKVPGVAGPEINLSVKLSALTAHFDPIAPEETAARVMPRLLKIVRTARRIGAFVNVDMEQYERRDLTISLFEQLCESDEFRDWPHLGIVAQCYLKDSEAALVRVIVMARRRGTPVTIRLVKGAYWDYEVIRARQENWPIPVWTEKWQSDAHFERLVQLMLENAAAVRTAVASHNTRSIARAMAVREQLGVSHESLEFQTLYGMADSLKLALRDMGVPVRVYMPFGPLIPGMGYLVRRLLENTANESFLRNYALGGSEIDELLQPPHRGPKPLQEKG